jgi:hypothetical protein
VPPFSLRNRLLKALPLANLAELWLQLESVDLPFRQVLQPLEKLMPAAYFVETGMVSLSGNVRIRIGHASP